VGWVREGKSDPDKKEARRGWAGKRIRVPRGGGGKGGKREVIKEGGGGLKEGMGRPRRTLRKGAETLGSRVVWIGGKGEGG